ncbi:hypothetical protein [Rhodococcus erythropolis]
MDEVGGKASGLIALNDLGLPVPPMRLVDFVPPVFPEFDAERVIIRPSEFGDSINDALAAQVVSGATFSAVSDRTSWRLWADHYRLLKKRPPVKYILQPYIDHSLGIMGHTETGSGSSYVAFSAAISDLAAGKNAAFEAVIEDSTRRMYTHFFEMSDSISAVMPRLAELLRLLAHWPNSVKLEWEAVVCSKTNNLYFLQCQASTAEIPDWSRS